MTTNRQLNEAWLALCALWMNHQHDPVTLRICEDHMRMIEFQEQRHAHR